ncbi:MAG: ABC transporter ATP-binding protein [Oscillospiraceae bacterium]|nr:ABC transporter ATP-binding protein [Oscillospiraceae bacterium]
MKIEIRGIAKTYGRKSVLRDVHFTAESGQCVGILGSNGCGKSTLLSILAGIQKCDAGSFLYEGKDLFRYPRQRARLVGYVPQGTPLFDELSAKDNLLLWYSGEELRKELEGGFLAMLGIGEFLKVPVHKMSGGMKKRLSIGCAIAGRPPILLLDEPMAALDLVCKQSILEYLRAHKKAGGILLLVTHDLLELELCDSWYIIKDGVSVPFRYDGNLKTVVESL